MYHMEVQGTTSEKGDQGGRAGVWGRKGEEEGGKEEEGRRKREGGREGRKGREGVCMDFVPLQLRVLALNNVGHLSCVPMGN